MPPLRRLFPTALCVLTIVGAAVPAAGKGSDPRPPSTDERRFAEEVARAGGPPVADVLATLAGARVQDGILAAIARPAEASKTWRDYRPIFVTDLRRNEGVAFYRENRELLDRIGRQYGVPPELIVAILGVETRYGRITGKYRVLDALVTLAFHYPPRAPFFRGELKQLFLLGDKHLAYPLTELKGSYAGAMGWGQFMPTSIAGFAVDGDGDGRIDLWNSLPDIVGSVANYFAGHGWESGGPVAVPALAAATAQPFDPSGLEPVETVQQFEAWGYAPLAHAAADRMANLLALDGERGREHWLTFRNFYVISRYNRSPLYSMAVWQLARDIAGGANGPVAAAPVPAAASR
jgi:membrane-bound lytic murein transglycosylase B